MNRHDRVRAVLRVQQAVGLTPSEFRAALTLAGLLFLGIVTRHWMERPPAYDARTYAPLQTAFAAHASRVAAADSLAEGLLPFAGDTLLPARRDSASGDSAAVRARPAGSRRAATGGPIDLNRAGADELMRLPRIGPALAGRILAWRRDHGPFRIVDDLMLVRGIGEKTMETLRPLVTVGGPADPTPAGDGSPPRPAVGSPPGPRDGSPPGR